MKPTSIILICCSFLWACTKQEGIPTPDYTQSETSSSNCAAGVLCFPPLQVDTTCVRMVMQLGGTLYRPLANYGCIIPNFFLGINQLWINGSTPGALKVVTLIMPTDISVGEYPLAANTAYDIRYVPSGDFNFFPSMGTITITTHNTADRFIEGGFSADVSLLAPPFTNIGIREGCFQAHY